MCCTSPIHKRMPTMENVDSIAPNIKVVKVDQISSSYMCPVCFKAYRVNIPKIDIPDDLKISISCDAGQSEVDEFYSNVKPLLITDLAIDPICCYGNGDNFLIPIDHDIIDMISQLNRKGYYTQSSCQGHRIDKYSQTSSFWSIIINKEMYEAYSLAICQWNVVLNENRFNTIVIEPIAGSSNYCIYPAVKSPVTRDIKNTFDIDEFTDAEYDAAYKFAIASLRQFTHKLPYIR